MCPGLHRAIREPRAIELDDRTRGIRVRTAHELSSRQVDMLLAGGLIPLVRQQLGRAA
jgi:aconitate hydratase